MSYRGRDLDLRTPERAHYRSEHWPDAAGGDAPVYVDEAVLACCNHGYDLALAHRAREVRIEHLLNAMTRTDAAASVLAGFGIDVAGLRQDTAGLIAADDNIVPGAERLSPRRSQLLADVLHLSAERARARGASVQVADLVRALFDINSDQPGLVMLKRNAPGWQPRAAGEPLRSEPLPPLHAGSYQPEPRFAPAEPPREWVRMPVAQPAYYQQPQPGYFVPEAPAPTGTVTDQVQNSRLDQLERTIRELSAELMAERKLVGQITGDYRRETAPSEHAMRARPQEERVVEDAAGLPVRPDLAISAMVGERLSLIERNVEAKFADLARGWTVLGERLQALEQAVIANAGGDEAAAGLHERLRGIEAVPASMAKLADRLSAIENKIAARPVSAQVNLEPVLERLAAIEHAQSSRPAATLTPIVDRLVAIERYQQNRSEAEVDLGPVVERLQRIEGRVGEINRGATGVAERVAQFDRKLEESGNGVEKTVSQIAERMRALEESTAGQRKLIGEFGDHIDLVVGEHIEGLSSAFEQTRTQHAQAAAEAADRIGGIEKLIQGFGQRTLDLHAAHGTDLVELHNALVKLNENQQALANSLDHWRVESGNEVSALLTRLDGVERANLRPMQMLESLQSNVQSLQRSTARREEQRSRFRHWLMGTDDWYGASWENGQPVVKEARRT